MFFERSFQNDSLYPEYRDLFHLVSGVSVFIAMPYTLSPIPYLLYGSVAGFLILERFYVDSYKILK